MAIKVEVFSTNSCPHCPAAIEAASTDDVANNTDSGIPGIDGKLHFSTRDQWEMWKQTRGLK